MSKSNNALCVCDLICLPVSSVGQRETRSCSEYTAISLCHSHVQEDRDCDVFASFLHVAIACVHVAPSSHVL